MLKDRSGNSRIGCGVLHDHGSTEVTTIESFELTSALEINRNSTSSKEVDDTEAIRVVGDEHRRLGARQQSVYQQYQVGGDDGLQENSQANA